MQDRKFTLLMTGVVVLVVLTLLMEKGQKLLFKMVKDGKGIGGSSLFKPLGFGSSSRKVRVTFVMKVPVCY